MGTKVIRTPIDWYGRYLETISSLLKEYNKTATDAQWRRMKVTAAITAVLGRHKESHFLDLEDICTHPGEDAGFAALMYFPAMVSRLVRWVTVFIFGSLLYVALNLWFSHYGAISPRWFGTIAITAFSVWLAMKRLGLWVCHRLSDNASIHLLGMFLRIL